MHVPIEIGARDRNARQMTRIQLIIIIIIIIIMVNV